MENFNGKKFFRQNLTERKQRLQHYLIEKEMDRKEEKNQERNGQKGILAGKVAVVTGASRGIGRAIALEFARKGAAVVINYNGSKDRAQEVQKCIEDEGNDAVLMQCDVSDFQACEAFFKKVIEQFGRLDILVNNAGITKDGLLMKLSEDDFDSVVDTNLKGSFHCMRFAARQMIRQKSGRIINLSSVSGVLGNAGQTNYSASKAGVIGLTKAAARELAAKNITVNVIAPGFIETDMTEKLSDRVRETAVTQIPMGHFGAVEDIAHAAAFLVSEEAAYITGQVLCVDGGMAM